MLSAALLPPVPALELAPIIAGACAARPAALGSAAIAPPLAPAVAGFIGALLGGTSAWAVGDAVIALPPPQAAASTKPEQSKNGIRWSLITTRLVGNLPRYSDSGVEQTFLECDLLRRIACVTK
jgi:hypothetical protein